MSKSWNIFSNYTSFTDRLLLISNILQFNVKSQLPLAHYVNLVCNAGGVQPSGKVDVLYTLISSPGQFLL